MSHACFRLVQSKNRTENRKRKKLAVLNKKLKVSIFVCTVLDEERYATIEATSSKVQLTTILLWGYHSSKLRSKQLKINNRIVGEAVQK